MLGIDTKQIPCIELQGVPTAATEGAVGLFGMNMLSADHEIYVCIAVNGNVYTWIPLKGEGGVVITGATINEIGELVLSLSNGTTINAGFIDSKQVDELIKLVGDIPIREGAGVDSIVQKYSGEINDDHPGNSSTGNRAVVFGEDNTNSGDCSLLSGKKNEVGNECCGAIGQGLKTNRDNQTYVGKYNEQSDDDVIFGVGNGKSDDDRSNALEVLENGRVKIQGSLRVKGALTLPNSPDNPETATVEDSFECRQTANPDVTGLTVVDGSTATIKKIQGASVISRNLLDPSKIRATTTINGVTFTNNGDGTITANGTATGYAQFPIPTLSAKAGFIGADYWYFSGCPSGGSADTFCILERSYTGRDVGNGAKSGNLYANNIAIIIASGYTANNLIFKPTISYGSVIPYADFEKYPFWAGFKNAQISGIKSTGKNLFDIEALKQGGDKWGINTCNIDLAPNTEYVFSDNYGKWNASTIFMWVCYKDELGNIQKLCNIIDQNYPNRNSVKFQTNNATEYYIRTYTNGLSEIIKRATELQIELGTTATDYTPYTESVMTLPETVELGAYDYIDVERQKIVRQTGEYVCTGTGITWSGASIGSDNWGGTNTCGFYFYYDGSNNNPNLDYDSGMMSTPITRPTDYFDWFVDKVGTGVGGGYFYVRVSRSILTAYGSDNSTPDANKTAFKAYLADLYAKGTPLTWAYKTKTATEEDIMLPTNKYLVWDKGKNMEN